MVKRDDNPEAEENIFLPIGHETDDFDESAYLEGRPDVAQAIIAGTIPSGLFHYKMYGGQESRAVETGALPAGERYSDPLPDSVATQDVAVAHSACHVDIILFSKTAGIFVVGWADETLSEVARLRIRNGFDECVIENWKLVRFRRGDVESALGFEGARNFGFCALSGDAGNPVQPGARSSVCQITFEFQNGAKASQEIAPRFVEDMSLLETALSYFGGVDFFGNKAVESLFALDGFLGNEFADRSRKLSQTIIAAASCERFGSAPTKPRGSIIVCIYGRPEYQFLQNAAFFSAPEARDYEFVYVCNSPELIEELCKTAAASWRIYGHAQSVVALPGNAGFGAANNVAAEFAQSDRLMFVNPDVLPMNKSWAKTHGQILDQDSQGNTDLFGAPLYYADGSLMHSGMYFEIDKGISVNGMEIRHRPMLRVEHFAKGAPHGLPEFTRSRPVPAVSGAFISVKRQLFEALDGFSSNYVFGHYEDADLCLRAMQKGTVPWVHNLPLWHLEGKGSRRLPHHEGASTVNRWQFGQMWHETIAQGLSGKAPASLAAMVRGTGFAPAGQNEKAEQASFGIKNRDRPKPQSGQLPFLAEALAEDGQDALAAQGKSPPARKRQRPARDARPPAEDSNNS